MPAAAINIVNEFLLLFIKLIKSGHGISENPVALSGDLSSWLISKEIRFALFASLPAPWPS